MDRRAKSALCCSSINHTSGLVTIQIDAHQARILEIFLGFDFKRFRSISCTLLRHTAISFEDHDSKSTMTSQPALLSGFGDCSYGDKSLTLTTIILCMIVNTTAALYVMFCHVQKLRLSMTRPSRRKMGLLPG